MPDEVAKSALEEPTPGVDTAWWGSPGAAISETATAASRTCGSFGSAQEHRPERSQGGAVTEYVFADCPTAAPIGRDFVAMLEAFRATGGTAPGKIVDRLLQEHQDGNAVSLAKLIQTSQAFGFQWRDCLWIPMFQFDAKDLTLKVSAQRVRAVLPPLWSGWQVATWFATPNVRLGGHAPTEMLDLEVEAVIRAAQPLQAIAQFSVPLVRPAREVAVQV